MVPFKLYKLIIKHNDFFWFACVGGTAFIIDFLIFTGLKLTELDTKPTLAKIIAGIIATIYSYYLNSKLTFRYRGGHKKQNEAALFFLISGLGVLIQSMPIFLANNIFHIRENLSLTNKHTLDFISSYLIGNILQMLFRFWALKKYAFPKILSKTTYSKQ